MKQITEFLDATYLQTAEQANITSFENDAIVADLLQNAVANKYKCVMILPEYVQQAKQFVIAHKSKVLVGTVISFPHGTASTEEKCLQIQNAINNGADELDVVIDYLAFKNGAVSLVQNQVRECTMICLQQFKTIKWIIETAALSNKEIIQITTLIKNVVIKNCKENDYARVFVKSSTGFFTTENNQPNGATPDHITLMLENATPLPVKASGGIKKLTDALFYIQIGVKRIGTSSQKQILLETTTI
ncbi:deoxyribose-phosphate aldolase [Flavobacterium sp. CBA20B-1]|uniref:deoxyribose-phosphate aldolase n=1 Tax=unclassified Flavobacterium TaxID=196869 RepID=UPI0022255479|nr:MULTISPECIES: deoxyribose-phosphate aldolase [unclassified Flavobacterium]WCM41737.1 deoxyribose-phosphate aldolase [Flavobacterium sp. CBA20B-1]